MEQLTETPDNKLLALGDRRHNDNEAGAFDIDIDSDLLRVMSGGSGTHNILFFREKTAKRLYNQLDNIFGDEE